MLKRAETTAVADPSTASGYRPDIEGLRGIAILSVVLYHLDARLLPGGFTGVDVFFVISGFLITGILLREYQISGRIDLWGFWARRARRILPSASLVLAVTTVLSLLLVSPLLLRRLGADILAAAYFGLNWRAASRAVDYSAPGEDMSPVIHYWSLAVEEQFYLAWPVILMALFFLVRKSGAKPLTALTAITGLILISSLVLCLYLAPINQPLAFFGTFTRVWQLLAGALAAIFLAYAENRKWPLVTVLGPLGLLAILAGFMVIVPDGLYPSLLSLLPVGGAVLVILAGSASGGANLGSRILSLSPLTFVGRISYVWYLWHWPFLYLTHAVFPAAGIAFSSLALALSFGLSVLTHYVFENPVRFHPLLVRSKLRSQGMGLALVAVTALAGFGMAQYARGVTVTLNDGRRILIEDITRNKSLAYSEDCHLSQIEIKHAPCVFGKTGAKVEMVLFGDSHAAHFFDAAEAASLSRDTAFLMRSKSGCPPLDGLLWNVKFKRPYYECFQWQQSVLATVRDVRPKLVILSSLTLYRPLNSSLEPPETDEESQRRYTDALHRMIVQLLDYTERVVIIADTPRLPEEPAFCLYRNPAHEEACTWPVKDLTSQAFYAPALADLGERVAIVDLNSQICHEGLCRTMLDEKPVFYDRGHLTATFSKALAGSFEKIFIDAGL